MKKYMFFLMATVMVLNTACDPENGEEVEKKYVPVTGVSLDKSQMVVAPNTKKTLKAVITPEDATNKDLEWSSSHAAVDIDESTGLLHVLSLTDATIIITVKTVDGGFTDTRTLTVVDIPAIGVRFNEPEVVVPPGRKKTLSATVLPNAAANKKVTWTSGNTAVATIDLNSGEVTAVSGGIAKITVKTDDGGHEADCMVKVPSMTNLLLNPGFEEGPSLAEPSIWIKLTQEWFNSFYEDPGTIAVNAGQTNRIGSQDAGFWGGNGAYFAPYRGGDFAARVQGNQTGGLYQDVTVISGKEYWVSMDIGYRCNNANTTIRTDETLKILDPDGNFIHQIPIVITGPNTGNGTSAVVPGVSGTFTVPENVVKLRFLVDVRGWSANPFQGPLILFDNCEFRQMPD